MRLRSSVLALLFATAALLAPAHALAQGGYFGRNKVQYQEFNFKLLQTEHFDIYFYPEEEEAARMASRLAERWYARLSSLLSHQLRGRQPLILYASGPHFRQTNAIEGELGEGTGGVTEAAKRRIVLPFAGPIESTDHVLGHELVHAFQYDITNTNANSGANSALSLPLWFIEGMAEYLSIGPVDPHTAMWMREAARREKLPDIKHLSDPRYFPYRYGQALWAFIGGKYGDRVIGDLLRVSIGRDGYDGAFKQILGVDSKALSDDWKAAEIAAYRPIAEATKMPNAFARPLITKEHSGGEMNVSPEISPDGSRLMFFSERDLFSIDLYLADAKTGKVIRKITNTATDPHYESLQFLASAGAWDTAGKRFVFPGISKGAPVLTIVNVDTGKRLREIPLKELDEVLNPAWSPDGNFIAFSGLVGGLNDLFVYDLSAGTLRRLTNDAYAELDPAWSPDGRQLAFSTDRFSTKLPVLEPGSLRLAVMDVASSAVREAVGFDGAKNISPQWTSDGRSLYFLSDRAGITNIYRAPIDGGAPVQLTNILTGVSGITNLSPALSTSNGRVVFSAYEDDGYNIYALEGDQALAGIPPSDLPVNAGGDHAALQIEALARLRRAADNWRRHRPVRHLRLGRRVVPLQRHPRQSHRRDVGAGDQSIRRVRRERLLFEPHASVELGGWRRSDPVHFARVPDGLRYRERPGRLCRARVSNQADRPGRHRSARLSVQQRPARRSERRIPSALAQPGRDRSNLRSSRAAADAGYDEPRIVPDAEPRAGIRRARARHFDQRADEPDQGQPVSPRAFAERRFADLHGHAR